MALLLGRGEIEHFVLCVIYLYLICRYMRPEGPWQPRSGWLSNGVLFKHDHILSQIDLTILVGPPDPLLP